MLNAESIIKNYVCIVDFYSHARDNQLNTYHMRFSSDMNLNRNREFKN